MVINRICQAMMYIKIVKRRFKFKYYQSELVGNCYNFIFSTDFYMPLAILLKLTLLARWRLNLNPRKAQRPSLLENTTDFQLRKTQLTRFSLKKIQLLTFAWKLRQSRSSQDLTPTADIINGGPWSRVLSGLRVRTKSAERRPAATLTSNVPHWIGTSVERNPKHSSANNQKAHPKYYIEVYKLQLNCCNNPEANDK